MIFSEITASDVILKLRLNAEELTAAELADISNILEEARKFIISYTGLTVSECDEFEDICAAVFVLCQDIYDNRGFYVDKTYVNRVVQHILDMHSKNYI